MKKTILNVIITLFVFIIGYSQDFTDKYITYTVTSNSPNQVATKDYNTAGGTVVKIPATVRYNHKNYTVTSIGGKTFDTPSTIDLTLQTNTHGANIDANDKQWTGFKSIKILRAPKVSIYKTNESSLRIAGLEQGINTIKIFNVLGKQVLSNSFESNGVKDLALPKVASGMYIIEVQSVTGKVNKKIVLE